MPRRPVPIVKAVLVLIAVGAFYVGAKVAPRWDTATTTAPSPAGLSSQDAYAALADSPHRPLDQRNVRSRRGALAWLAALAEPDEEERSNRIAGLIASSDPAAIVSAAVTAARAGPPERRDAAGEIFRVWGEIDGWTAVGETLRFSTGGAFEQFGTAAMAGWARVDLVGARAFTDTVEDAEKRDWLRSAVVEALVARDLDEAFRASLSLRSDGGITSGARALATAHHVRGGVYGVQDWLSQVADETSDDASRGSYRQSAFHEGAVRMLEADPVGSAEWIITNQHELAPEFTEKLATVLFPDRPSDQVGFLLEVAEGATRQGAVSLVLERWVLADAGATLDWLHANLSSPDVVHVVIPLARKLSEVDALAAEALFTLLPDHPGPPPHAGPVLVAGGPPAARVAGGPAGGFAGPQYGRRRPIARTPPHPRRSVQPGPPAGGGARRHAVVIPHPAATMRLRLIGSRFAARRLATRTPWHPRGCGYAWTPPHLAY